MLRKFRLVEMRNRATCVTLAALAVLLSACTSPVSPDVRSPSQEGTIRSEVTAQRPRSTPDKTDPEGQGKGVGAAQVSHSIVFQCIAENGKEITLLDRGETIDYSYGLPGHPLEMSVSKPRDEATTYQWDGFGRWISYSVSLHNGDTTYTVFTSADRLSDGHELEAGVTAIVGDREVARFICRPPLINKLEGIDLNPEGD